MLAFWRSPGDQPRWARPVLLLIAAAAATVEAWNIAGSGYALYYSVAVRSMSVSWKSFWYGGFDPGATITIDKLAGSFVPQALSARLFGYHDWALALPQVVEGTIAVLVMYRAVRRWFGVPAGLLAAGILAGTPILASMFGHPMEDGLLVMCLVLAADAAMRAVIEARPRSLVLAGVWVGVGFQAKMLQAWMVLPALALTYLLLAAVPWHRRLLHLLAAGLATLAVSLSWILLYEVTPAADRPYVDGSTDNSAFAMVFGYNGLDRFGIHVPGAAPPMLSTGPGIGGYVVADTQGWGKLVGVTYGRQVGWLYPLVLVALAVGLWRYRRCRPELAGFVCWGGWLATYAVVFSGMALPHTAYLGSLAPPVAALSAAGIVMLSRNDRPLWALPVVAVAEAAWALRLSYGQPGLFGWLGWIAVAAAILALVVAAAARRPAMVLAMARTRRPAMVLAVVAMLVAPLAWAGSVLDRDHAGSAFDASAGPQASTGPVGNDLMRRLVGDGTLNIRQQAIHTYLMAHRDGARYLAATQSWMYAGQLIMATGEPYLALGGFSGAQARPMLDEVVELVRGGRLRFFVLSSFGGGRAPGMSRDIHSQQSQIVAWVQTWCAEVPAAEYRPTVSAAGSTGRTIDLAGTVHLYSC